MTVIEHGFDSREALAEALADTVAERLREALGREPGPDRADRGRASLVVSGGSTPVPFFTALRSRTLDWDRVTVTLADDRWVPADDERSNERLVRRELLSDAAAEATFVPLVTGDARPEDGLSECARRLRDVTRPFDVVVLGMGADGHTASLFPGAAETAAALEPGSDALCATVRPTGDLEPRISMTLAALVNAGHLFLHITGDEKHRVLQEALDPASPLPVGTVLRHVGGDVDVYWSP